MPVRLSSRVMPLSGAVAALSLLFGAASARAGTGVADTPITVRPITAEELAAARPVATDVIGAVNAVRANPSGYSDTLHGSNPATQQAVIDLRGLSRPPPPLAIDDRLTAAAVEQVGYLGGTGLLTHTGYGGSTPGVRIRSQGYTSTMVAEELAFGQSNAGAAVRQLIIDAGVTGAPHRRDLLSSVFTYAGAACGPHPGQGRVCVIILANNPFGEVPTIAINDGAADAPDIAGATPGITPGYGSAALNAALSSPRPANPPTDATELGPDGSIGYTFGVTPGSPYDGIGRDYEPSGSFFVPSAPRQTSLGAPITLRESYGGWSTGSYIPDLSDFESPAAEAVPAETPTPEDASLMDAPW